LKTKRLMIEIDEERCDGCGQCVPSCHEGALQIIDGKARLVAESLCDGLGACLGECPQDALKVVERWVDPFEAPPVQAGAGGGAAACPPASAPESNSAPVHASAGTAAAAHPHGASAHEASGGGCPGSRMRMLRPAAERVPQVGDRSAPQSPAPSGAAPAAPWEPETSRLGHWPVQIRLVPPHAPFLENADLVVAADCVPVALPGFHQRWVDGKAVMIGCPKFDDLDDYTARFTALFSRARVRSVSVLVMEVPCCQSLPVAVLKGMEAAGVEVQTDIVVVGVDGEIRMRRRVKG
jgi:NAD-dependent dihydropyrimidine dehydrogenase PreA subunit